MSKEPDLQQSDVYLISHLQEIINNKNKEMSDILYLSKDKNLFFHWSDWKKTCEIIQKESINDYTNLKTKKSNLIDEINLLKGYSLYLDKNGKRFKSNLYELYSTYFDPRLRKTLFENKDVRFLLSSQGPQGPYMDAYSLRWLDEKIYLNYVYLGLINNQLPQRNFRIRTRVDLKGFSPTWKNIHSTNHAFNISCQQITNLGMLVKIDKKIMEHVLNQENSLLHLDVFPLVEAIQASDFSHKIFLNNNKNLLNHTGEKIAPTLNCQFLVNVQELIEGNTELENLKVLNQKSGHPQIYLFIKYSSLRPQVLEDAINSIILPFFDGVQKEFCEELEEKISA